MVKENVPNENKNPTLELLMLEDLLKIYTGKIKEFVEIYNDYVNLYNKSDFLSKSIFEKEIKIKINELDSQIKTMNQKIEDTKKELKTMVDKFEKEN